MNPLTAPSAPHRTASVTDPLPSPPAGDQPFATDDGSRNNRWVAWLTLGEGWHNLHHAFEASVRQGYTLRRGELVTLPDPTYRFIRLLETLGWARRLRYPSERALRSRARLRPRS